MSQVFTSGAQSIGASASALVLPMNIEDWFPLGLTGVILQFKGLSRVFSSSAVWKHPLFGTQPSSESSSHTHLWLLEKQQLWQYRPLLTKWRLCFLICCLGLPVILSLLQSPSSGRSKCANAFIFLIWKAFMFSSCLMARTSSTMLTRSDESRHPCLIANLSASLRGKPFSLYHEVGY